MLTRAQLPNYFHMVFTDVFVKAASHIRIYPGVAFAYSVVFLYFFK